MSPSFTSAPSATSHSARVPSVMAISSRGIISWVAIIRYSSILESEQGAGSLDDLLGAWDLVHLDFARVGNGCVIRAEPTDRRLQFREQLLTDGARHLGAETAELGRRV